MKQQNNKQGGLHMTTEQVELAIAEFNAQIAAERARINRQASQKPRYVSGYKSKYSGKMS